jgi:hypothetical protein
MHLVMCTAAVLHQVSLAGQHGWPVQQARHLAGKQQHLLLSRWLRTAPAASAAAAAAAAVLTGWLLR